MRRRKYQALTNNIRDQVEYAPVSQLLVLPSVQPLRPSPPATLPPSMMKMMMVVVVTVPHIVPLPTSVAPLPSSPASARGRLCLFPASSWGDCGLLPSIHASSPADSETLSPLWRYRCRCYHGPGTAPPQEPLRLSLPRPHRHHLNQPRRLAPTACERHRRGGQRRDLSKAQKRDQQTPPRERRLHHHPTQPCFRVLQAPQGRRREPPRCSMLPSRTQPARQPHRFPPQSGPFWSSGALM